MPQANAIIKVSPAGYNDSQVPALCDIPLADPLHFVAAGANGTWLRFITAGSTVGAAAAAGRITFKLDGVLMYIPCFTAPLV